MTGEDLVILGVAVPRGWRDFLYAYPQWKGQNPKIRDSLSEELREMVRAEVARLIDEIAVGRPDVAAALVEQYSLQDRDTPTCCKEAKTASPEPVGVSLEEAVEGEPELVTMDEIRVVNGYFTRALRDQLPPGAELHIGEKMVEEGRWKLIAGPFIPSPSYE